MPFKSGKKNSYIASKGGRKGGPARAASLTPERRKEIAQKAIAARWGRAKQISLDSAETEITTQA